MIESVNYTFFIYKSLLFSPDNYYYYHHHYRWQGLTDKKLNSVTCSRHLANLFARNNSEIFWAILCRISQTKTFTEDTLQQHASETSRNFAVRFGLGVYKTSCTCTRSHEMVVHVKSSTWNRSQPKTNGSVNFSHIC